jgi:hypothetical protein
MTEPVSQSGWIARTFTRARVLGVHLARIPFGDKSFDLPVVFSRTQLTAAAVGGFTALIAFAIGSKLGIAAWTTWPVVIATFAVVIGLGFSSAPDRGAGLMLEGYTRMAWAALPFTSSVSSSRRRPKRQRGPQRIQVRMQMHPPIDSLARRGAGR